MVFANDHPNEALRGKAKGIKQVLEERGLWQEGLLKICGTVRQKWRTCLYNSLVVPSIFWSNSLTSRPKIFIRGDCRGRRSEEEGQKTARMAVGRDRLEAYPPGPFGIVRFSVVPVLKS